MTAMMNTRQTTDIDGFVRRFRDYPRDRAALITGLISEHSIFTLNIPRVGPARLIAERLAEGPFSDFYEFEKMLARSIHPLLAGLNLNVITDIQVNTLFEKKFLRYAKRYQRILAGNRRLTLAALKDVILEMIAVDGHNMAVKFYDLVIRPVDPGLFRNIKPVEIAIIEMKNRLCGDAAKDGQSVRAFYSSFMKNYGAVAAGLLTERVAWDPELNGYLRQPGNDEEVSEFAEKGELTEADTGEIDEGGEEEARLDGDLLDESDAGQGPDSEAEETTTQDDAILLEEIGVRDAGTAQEGPAPEDLEPEMADTEDAVLDTDESDDAGGQENRQTPPQARPSGAGMGRIGRYAEILRDDFLLGKRPDDEDGIRGLVQGIYAKNEMRFGADRAAEIIHAVLSLWIRDETLNGWMRGILSDILDERSGTSTVHEGPDDFVPLEDDPGQPSGAPDADGGSDASDDAARAPERGDTADSIPVDDSIAIDDSIEVGTETPDTSEGATESDMTSPDEQSPDLADTSEEELRALLSGTGDMVSGEEAAPARAAASEEIDRIDPEDIVPVVDVAGADKSGGEEFLISEEEFRELTKPVGGKEKGNTVEDSFLVEDGGIAPMIPDDGDPVDLDLEFEPGGPAGKRFAARKAADGEPEPSPSPDDAAGAESFIVKDEILFEDSSLKRKKRNEGQG